MNHYLERLFHVGEKTGRMIVGLMSGTSLDGLDVALCRCTGSGTNTTIDLLRFETIPYDAAFKTAVKSVFSRRDADLEQVCLLNGWIGEQHAAIINDCLQRWEVAATDIDLIASHGQTIYHAPRFQHRYPQYSNATLQIGDGDHIAVNTGIITISDFRQRHVAAGGEGAPLAVYGDYLVFSKAGENRIMLNMGGIANFTFLPGDLDAGRVFSTDTGTGNTLMDNFMQQEFAGEYFDEGGKVAASGKVHTGLLQALKDHSFFAQPLPRTTGPELFNLAYLQEAIEKAGIINLTTADTMATLNRFSAETIAEAILQATRGMQEVCLYASGGGMHNPVLMAHLQELLPGFIFKDTGTLQIDPDAKEAVLFAVLANECVAGGHTQLGNGSGAIPFVSMGKISFPG